MNLNVYVVILNWNRFDDTKYCLESLIQINSKGIDLTISVIDNGSMSDQISRLESHLEKVKKTTKLKILLIKNGKNLGFAEGNNVGISHAIKSGADYVLVINNDTYVHKNFLKCLVNIASKDDNIGALTPKIYFADGYEFHKNRYRKGQIGKVIWSTGGKIDWNNIYGSNRGVDEVDEGQYDKLCETDFATGACVLYKAKALKESGLFDPRYFLYLEDTDLSMRLKKSNYKIVYVPDSVIWHKVAQSSGIGSDLNDYFITRNRLLFGFKYASLKAKFALFRESVRFAFLGRKWQKIGVFDFYMSKYGIGSWGIK